MRGVVAVALIGCGTPAVQPPDATDAATDGVASDASVDAWVDAPPIEGVRIGGRALGMRGPVVLALEVGGARRHVAVTHDGSFWFPGGVATNSTYDATLQDPRCRLPVASGTAGTADTMAIELYCPGVVELQSAPLVASGSPAAPFAATLSPAFRPGVTAYTGTRPFFMDDTDLVTVTPTAAYPTRPAIRVYSDQVGSGQASPPHAIGPGPVIALVDDSGLSRTYAFTLGLAAPAQSAYVKGSEVVAGDRFGSVALSGDTLVVGAPTNGNRAGAIYVFTRSGTTWTQHPTVLRPSAITGARVGTSVAIDGDVLVAGAPGDGLVAGAAYVYRRTAGTWSLDATLTATSPLADDGFGTSVAVSASLLVVGAPRERGGGNTLGVGAAYMFRAASPGWTGDGKFQGASAQDNLGTAVAISGTTALVSILGLDAGAVTDAGGVNVYVRGGAWAQSGTTIRAPSPSAFAEYGKAVAIDGDVAVIGEPAVGRAYVMRRGAPWTVEQALVGGPSFGCAVAIDREHLVVGQKEEATSNPGVNPVVNTSAPRSGAAYAFRRDASGWTNLRHFIKASNPGGIDGALCALGDQFGSSVALEGEWFVVGAPNECSNATTIGGDQTNDNAPQAGAVYAFR